MDRRAFLAALTTTAGCSGAAPVGEGSKNENPTSGSGGGGEPTVRSTDTPNPSAEEVLNTGDWLSFEKIAVRITYAETATQVEWNDYAERDGVAQVADGKQIAFVSMDLKNISQQPRGSFLAGKWGVVAGSKLHPESREFPMAGGGTGDTVDTVKATTLPRYYSGIRVEPVESGGVVGAWYSTTVPKGVDFRPALDVLGGSEYEIQWRV